MGGGGGETESMRLAGHHHPTHLPSREPTLSSCPHRHPSPHFPEVTRVRPSDGDFWGSRQPPPLGQMCPSGHRRRS